MNKKVIYSILFILLASCTGELPNTPDQIGQEQGVPVLFSVSIEPEKNEFSRSAVTGYYLPDNSEVGIYALKGKIYNGNFTFTENTNEGWEWDSKNIQDNFSNAKYLANNFTNPEDINNTIYSQLIPAEVEETGKFPSKGALRFLAYYPYNENAIVREAGDGSGQPLVPTIKIQIGEDIETTTDYMYTGTIDIPSTQIKPVNLHFKHALGRFNIFVHTEQNTGDWRDYPSIKKISIETFKSQEGTMNLETGAIQPGTSKFYKFEKEFNPPYYIQYKKSSKELKPIYSNMFIPNVEGQEQFLYKINLTIENSEGEESVVEYKKSALENHKIKINAGQITNLYINYNRNE